MLDPLRGGTLIMKILASSLFLVALPLVSDCGGTTHAGFGDAGGNAVGGSCQSCATDQDCETFCGAPSQPGYRWCCASKTCYSWSSSNCPVSSSSSGSGGSSGGNGSSGGTAGSCTGRSSCPSGQQCCLRLSGFGGTSGSTPQCLNTCSGLLGTYQVCQTSAECTGGRTCRMLTGAGGVTVCR
jgi:hypothetical protein